MKTIKKIDSKSVANICGLAYAVVGLVFGLVVLIISLVTGPDGVDFFGIVMPIVLGLFYGLIGWVGGFVCAFVYNLIAKKIGGIKVEIE